MGGSILILEKITRILLVVNVFRIAMQPLRIYLNQSGKWLGLTSKHLFKVSKK